MTGKWGPITWVLLHSLAEHINEDSYLKNRTEIFNVVRGIVENLPCPECRYHATNYFKRIHISNYNTKQDFILMIYTFHNAVNVRLAKPKYSVEGLERYKKRNTKQIWTVFKIVFTSNNHSRLLSEQLTRKLVIGRIEPLILNSDIYDI